MIEAIQRKIDRLTDYRDRIAEIIQEELMNNEDFILTMNADDQLYDEGINRVGVSIEDYAPYTMRTLAIKTEKGQPTDRVTLRDTGAFEQSFFIEFRADEFEIKASDFKAEKLVVKYGKQIMGLTDENVQRLIKKITPRLIWEINR
jgi:hypothetical protein